MECAAQKSKKMPTVRCKHPATHGEYCGLHYKHPRPWIGGACADRITTSTTSASSRIARWLGLCLYRRHGPAWAFRTLCTNDTDFYSTESMKEIPLYYFVSYADPTQKHIYGFDVRSVHTLVASNPDAEACNPYTRVKFPSSFLAQIRHRIDCLKRTGRSIDWDDSSADPLTPEQVYRNTVVDTFCAIDGLGYYTSPDWFFDLTLHRHRRFYAELYTRWHTHSASQKHAIVPMDTDRVFHISPHATLELSLGILSDLNIRMLHTLVTAGTEKDDRVLGALDGLCALTVVSSPARSAYPWLYEHAIAPPPPPTPHALFGRWVNAFVPIHILGNTYRL